MDSDSNHNINHLSVKMTRIIWDDMNTQFASKASASISSLDPNLKVYQASFQPYRTYDQNDDRTVVLKLITDVS